MLRLRVITATVMLLLLLLTLFVLPEIWWTIVVVLVAAQGASEWSRLSRLGTVHGYVFWAVTLGALIGLVWLDSWLAPGQRDLLHLPVYIASALLWLLIVPAWLIAGWKTEQPWIMMMTGWALLVPTALAMLDLRAVSPWLLLFIMGLVAAADISAYFAGRRFGKSKLAPSISPGKTWEGVAGAMIGVSVYIVTVWMSNAYLKEHLLLTFLLMSSWWWVGLAVIGDLFESAIKRQAGVKDSGALLPGHGGLLDRIDALTSTLPLAALVILLQRLS